MSKIVSMTAAALLAGSLLGAIQAVAQQQNQGAAGGGATAAPSSARATGACRVKDFVGGRSCTADVPEAACAAIAREAKGQYTWGAEPCP